MDTHLQTEHHPELLAVSATLPSAPFPFAMGFSSHASLFCPSFLLWARPRPTTSPLLAPFLAIRQPVPRPRRWDPGDGWNPETAGAQWALAGAGDPRLLANRPTFSCHFFLACSNHSPFFFCFTVHLIISPYYMHYPVLLRVLPSSMLLSLSWESWGS